MKRLADRIWSLLKESGLAAERSMEEYAADLGVRADALRDAAERRTRRPRVEVLAALVRCYGVDPSWLITGVYNPRTHEIASDAVHVPGALRRLLAAMADGRDHGDWQSSRVSVGPFPTGA